ncbi:uncharacterized protein FIBRA_05823 [Fibroporia radiculosa]|uniref:Uncharacterized protein n=1 Tax=Fibroporia radiculosa TaxID=599839 RepID=J4H3R0_9APHY|nr:uncharacterized protein FIBRA_05823 [Fibroporia radiculosa]CCM03679.1 predicted protein [Fibroporia radiculosa]
MPPRPPLAARSRPLSAIYIGSGSTPTASPPTIPDLPEPPSPSTSIASGLPSPPATNSTGSGSIDDDNNSNDAGSLRQRTPARSNTISYMANGNYDRPHSTSWSRQQYTDDEDEGNDNENEEDNTARLSDGRRAPKATPQDNLSALQRVKNLTQRNRMVLDKLTSISRLNSPVPSNASRSPLSPPSALSSSSSSSRVSSSHPRPQSASNPLPTNTRSSLDPSHSGSETERESQHISSHSYPSSDDLSATPPSNYYDFRAPPPIRERRISAPASPAKAGRSPRDRDRGPSPGPSRTPRKRVSMAMSVDEGYRNVQQEDELDVTTAALAAVASSRRSPTGSGGKRNRQPLPREFREKETRSPEEKPNGEPSTPHRQRHRNGRSSPSSPGTSRSNFPNTVQTSPRRPGASRYSTVRDLTRKHQTRWLSEDLSGDVEGDTSQRDANNANAGRRQGHRGGSSDGLLMLTNGRSLVGEGLRAAGLTKRREEDPFTSGGAPASPRRTKSTGNSSVIQEDWELAPARNAGYNTRISEGVGPPVGRDYDPRTPINNLHRRSERANNSAGQLARPGTSMAALHHDSPDNVPPRTAPAALRQYKSTYALADRDRNTFQQEFGQAIPDRAYSSPFANGRSASTALPPGASPGMGRDSNTEHRRLMLEALTMFESHLSRLPPMGQTTTTTIPELFQSAQHLVHALDRLNGMLKVGTNKALEAQIEAEVADTGEGVDLVDLWRSIGAEHRESLRVSDEVVRNMTGFLLGVGKVLRESNIANGQQQHLRTMSLDEEVARRATPDIVPVANSRVSDGRKSRETRRSWDPRDARESVVRMSSREASRARPGSSLNLLRGSATSSSEGRSVADAVGEQTPQTVRNVSSLAQSSSIRRMYITRESRATPDVLPSLTTKFDYQDSPGNHEPSPTPTSRTSHSALSERPRNFPPLAVPPTLSTLPSESIINHNNTSPSESVTRRKVSSNSNITVRAEQSTFNSVIKPPNATTALTPHTVSMLNSPAQITQALPSPLSRSESSSSARTNGVTFSRPSTISLSALNGVQERDERSARLRVVTTSSSGKSDNERERRPNPITKLAPAAVISPMSGSETERPESWRRTIGARPRISLDSTREAEGAVEVRSASRNATISATRKERRRTITEIFQR